MSVSELPAALGARVCAPLPPLTVGIGAGDAAAVCPELRRACG